MTKTTEELKRDLYHGLTLIKNNQDSGMFHFENSLEAYLEALRIEAIKGFGAIELLKEERDQLRNKLQAFEYANKSAGEFLQEAQAKVKRQRQSIGQLKNDRDNARNLAGANYTKYQKARKELSELRQRIGSTIAQNRKENVSFMCPSSPDGHDMSDEGLCKHCNEIIVRAMQ